MRFLLNVALCSILFTFSTQFKILKIGAIFFHDELDLLEALQTAIHDINRLELDVRLESVQHFLGDDDSIDLQYLACDLIANGVAAILGPSSKASSNIVEILCNITGIPHLQFDTRVSGTPQLRHNRQLTVNVAPSQFMLSSAIWAILRNPLFDWKSFTIVYEASTNFDHMQELLAWRAIHKTGIKMRKFERGEDYRNVWKYVSSTREKFVVLECPADIVVEVVNASILYNMTSQFNKLFLTNLDTHTSNLYALYSQEFKAFAMAIRLRRYIPITLNPETDVFEDTEGDKLTSLNTQLIYDAVVMFFTAARDIIRALHFYDPHNIRCGRGFWKSGPKIVLQMKSLTSKNATLPYKTQKLHLDEFGERDDFNLELYNPLTEQVTHVWNSNQQLVLYDSLVENSTKKARKYTVEKKEDFSQKRVRYTVATRIGAPYFRWRQVPEGMHYEGNERFEGYAVDLIYALGDICKFDFIFEPVADNNYGSYDPLTNEWNGIIRQLIDNTAHLGICDLTITMARRTVVDFTVPFMQLGISILYYQKPVLPKSPFEFLKPYAFVVWLYLLISLLVVSLLFVLAARISQSDWENPSPMNRNVQIVSNQWDLRNALWLMIGSIMTTGCNILPRGFSVRLFTAFWWIFALLLSQTYTAKLASFITSSKMEGSIQNLHDLVDQNKIKFGTVKGGSTSMFFAESNETDYRLAWNKMKAMKPDAFTDSNEEGVDRVSRSSGNYAFLMETTNLHYHLRNNCQLTQIGEAFGVKHYGIAVPLNAHYRSNLSVGILKLSEQGVLNSLKTKWFNKNADACGQARNKDAKGSRQYDMEMLGGLFVVLIAGGLLAALIGVCEFLWNVHNIAFRNKVRASVVLKTELKFFLCFWRSRKSLRNHDLTPDCHLSALDQSTSTATAKKKKKKKKKPKKNMTAKEA